MNRRLKTALIVALPILTAGFLFYAWKSTPTAKLTVVSWPGTYGQAQGSAQMTAFAQVSGVYVRIAQYEGGTKEIATQVAQRQYDWDVVDMELPDAVAACRAGLLERLDIALPSAPDGTPAAADFHPGAIGPCWVASIVYSHLIGFDAARFRLDPPKTLADVFDPVKYPGKRAIAAASGKYTLEMALLADGVAPGDVYETLSSPAGVMRALRKLDSIKADILWLKPGEGAATALSEGRAAFALVLNNDIFEARGESRPLGGVWDGQLLGFDVFAIPRGDPRRALALDYIRFATSTKALGDLARWLPYGPARKSANAGIGKNPALDEMLTPYHPTAAGRLHNALTVDDAWWRLHGEDVDMLWQAWVKRAT